MTGTPPTPANKRLYASVKAEADSKFMAPTSAYKSAWIVREYKNRGGTYTGAHSPNNGLVRWFKEKWVDLAHGKEAPCGRPKATLSDDGNYPLCRPSVRVTKDTPKTVKELSKRAVAAALKKKQVVKHRGRVKF